MTGYGRGECADGVRTATAEIRAVNHRYCEVSVKTPGKYAFAEDAVKTAVKNAARRGKIDVTINVVSTAPEDASVVFNPAAAKQYFSSLRELQDHFDVEGAITLDLLASMPDVLRPGRPDIDEDKVRGIMVGAAAAALAAFDEMRRAEGRSLADDMTRRLDGLAAAVEEIRARAPEVQQSYAARLRERIRNLAERPVEGDVFEQRVAMEIAIFADKASIDEEIVRLLSHAAQFRGILAGDGEEPVGKKLDFLVQEMNREANTIGAKANDLKITDRMIELKNGIENIREQVQNVC
jgi:uncharacterized protein (TIGR00255 family)